MKLDTTFLRSKVARRIFMLFMISAVVPIITLAVISFNQVNTLINDQTSLQLHSESKAAGMAILERLSFIRNELKAYGALLDKNPASPAGLLQGEYRKRLATYFRSITVVSSTNRPTHIFGQGTQVPQLTTAELHHLSEGKTLITVVPAPGPRQTILMRQLIKPRQPGRGLVIAEITPASLLDFESTDTGILTLVDASGRLLYTTDPAGASVQKTALRASTRTSTGVFNWYKDGQSYRAGYWNLFLRPDFLIPRWTVVVSEPEADVLAQTRQFHRLFPPVIALSLFVVILLSISQIRRHLVPLERLRDAAGKAADRDFRNAAVEIHSGDEFEELAGAFNAMTSKLGRQFSVLSAMAEIDRSILSALDADYIIDTLLRRMPEVVPCDFVFVVVIEKGAAPTAQLRIGVPLRNAETEPRIVSLSADEMDELKKGEVIFVGPTRATLPAYLAPLGERGATDFILFPVMLPDGLAGVIGLAYRDPPALDPEDIAQAGELADRTAVALSNAAWGEKLYHHAHYDALTDLPNRLLLKDRLEQALARASRDGSLVGVLFIDLDRFKKVNDSLGHRTGDQLLVHMAAALAKCVRKADTVVRLGGDEFTVVIPDIDPGEEAVSVISSIARMIMSEFSLPLVIDDREISITTSIGIAVYPKDADNFDDILKNADSAMYHAKDMGGNNFQFYSPQLNAWTLEQLKLESDLRRALERDELRLYYQPQIATDSGRVVGAEALLRWQHPEMGMVSPAKFIPLAEETGLIVPIGEWVLRTACAQNKAWRDQGLEDIMVSVNIAARQFSRSDLVDRVKQVLAQSELEPASLGLEITEETIMDNAESTVERLHQLKELGVYLSIDDFGTGYSSLSYLKRFPIDHLKIDYVFIKSLPEDVESMCIVRAIIAMAHGLNLTVVAEGVETAEQYEFLKQQSCEMIQGYYFAKPMPADEFRRFLADNHRRETCPETTEII